MKMRKFVVMIGIGLACAMPAGAWGACVASIQSISAIPNVMYAPFDGVEGTASFAVVMRNDGADACSGLGLAIASTTVGSTRLFKNGGNSIDYVVTSGNRNTYVNDIGVPRGSNSIAPGIGNITRLTVVVRIPAGRIAPAQTYSDELSFQLYAGAVPMSVVKRAPAGAVIEARAQVNIAGSSPSGWSSFGIDEIDFGTLITNEFKTANVQVRATKPVLILISSENRGKLKHKVLSSANVPYTMKLDNEDVDLASSFTLPRDRPVTLSGDNYPMVLTIGPTEDRPAGEYEDTLTITVSPQ